MRISLIVALLIIMIGCSSPEIDTPAIDGDAPTVDGELATVTTLGDQGAIDYGNASISQGLYLADNLVTYDEYERATEEAIVCMEENGVAVSKIQSMIVGGIRQIQFDYVPANRNASEIDFANAGEVYERCVAEFSYYVGLKYIDERAPSVEEILAEFSQIAACLGDQGVVVEDPKSPESLVSAVNGRDDLRSLCFPEDFFGQQPD